MLPFLLFSFYDGPKLYHRYNENRAWLGISTTELTPQLRDYFGVEKELGILVSEVAENSPAAKSGLKAGDVITEADGESIYSHKNLVDILREFEPGEELELKYIRNQGKEALVVELGQSDKFSYKNFGYNPGKIKIHIPEVDIDIPNSEIPEFDKQEIDRLQDEIRKELKFHDKELKEQMRELRERMKEIKIDVREELSNTI